MICGEKYPKNYFKEADDLIQPHLASGEEVYLVARYWGGGSSQGGKEFFDAQTDKSCKVLNELGATNPQIFPKVSKLYLDKLIDYNQASKIFLFFKKGVAPRLILLAQPSEMVEEISRKLMVFLKQESAEALRIAVSFFWTLQNPFEKMSAFFKKNNQWKEENVKGLTDLEYDFSTDLSMLAILSGKKITEQIIALTSSGKVEVLSKPAIPKLGWGKIKEADSAFAERQDSLEEHKKFILDRKYRSSKKKAVKTKKKK